MKTKLIILTAIAAIILHSCSTDRDEDVRKEKIESVKASNKEFNLNKIDLDIKSDSSLKVDTLKGSSISSGEILSNQPENGEEPIVDPTKPDKPW